MRKATLSDDGRCDEQFFLMNPFLRCEPEQSLTKKGEFSDFKVGLVEKIGTLINQGKADHVSVYLRDLRFGPWMGIGEDDMYSAASLLKVPVLLTVLRLAEQRPSILAQRVEITPELIGTYKVIFQPEKTIEAGKIYTVDELLVYMIVYSDNNATNALHAYLATISPDEPLFVRTMEELGYLGDNRTEDNLSVKQSASMFRILYNGSYLGKEMSQKALLLLSSSAFREGIVAGVPPGTAVAHKFGERIDAGSQQLHDCGIVYHPQNHYLLCIMTKGKNEHTLATVIVGLSQMIYEEMNRRSGKM